MESHLTSRQDNAVGGAMMSATLAAIDAMHVVETLPFGIITLDSAGTITFANSSAAETLGWSATRLMGRHFHDTAHHHRADGTAYPQQLCPIHLAHLNHSPHTIDRETLWRSDGTPVICDITTSPLDGDGLTLTIRDALARLELSRAQDEFVSVVSHELRTPLASLLGALKMSSIDGLETSQRESLIAIAQRNADRLARLVDDILDLEKVRTGAISLARTEMSGISLCQSAADAVAGTALTRDVSIAIDAQPVSFWADRMRLEQVLTNLLDNAIKHSEAGSTVTLRVRKRRADVAIEVIDEGHGIDPEGVKHVFDRFWQVDSSNQRARQGSGLGLTISKAIIELHGGSIGITSELGAGTCFTVKVPLRAIDLAVPIDLRSDGGEADDASRPAD
jgi:PAS domain S-box-containing protein